MPHSEHATPEPDEHQLPYWLLNVPKSDWPKSCPDYLQDISPRNRAILSVDNDKFVKATWEQVKEIVHLGDINQFRRAPLDLRKYLKYTAKLKAAYSSISNFIITERLRWTTLEPRAGPFEHPEDYKILYNDWPYALDPQITHLVCWVKFELAEDPTTNRSTPEAEKQMDDFVTRTFGNHLPEGSVVWFKNYKALKSVHDLEHFHIMLHGASESFLRAVTGGDVPMVEKVGI